MATSSEGEVVVQVPQWKKELRTLIQRRKQTQGTQDVKVANKVTPLTGALSFEEDNGGCITKTITTATVVEEEGEGSAPSAASAVSNARLIVQSQQPQQSVTLDVPTASTPKSSSTTTATTGAFALGKMRLEPDSPTGHYRHNHSRHNHHPQEQQREVDSSKCGGPKMESSESGIKGQPRSAASFELERVKLRKLEPDTRNSTMEDTESDSSEELQYGPGIVNKLKSKYLNLTLREMNSKSRSGVQRFRRAASLEDLLECEAEPSEKGVVNSSGKYKRNSAGGVNTSASSNVANSYVVAKTQRYRNSTRGNDSIKRARSVETLVR